jgi:hypothetical protein
VDAAEDDDVGFGPGRLPAEAERIAADIGDRLDLVALVVVRQDDRIPLFSERRDLMLQAFKILVIFRMLL